VASALQKQDRGFSVLLGEISMSELRSGTMHLADAEFVRAFESCELPNTSFHHADHVRLAWLYVREHGEEQAAQRMVEAIRRFAAFNGAAKKFHYTVTCAWVRLISAASGRTPAAKSFQEFLAAHPELLQPDRLGRYYSPAVLDSPAAREAWVPPDLTPLP
jgi:2'-5' RNA ligase